ncbi:MFS transporter [Streptomyces regensis]|nr:MFS transporter [Streptomyces regensis]
MLADSVPFYPLYALLFADSGLSESEIAALLAIWSITGVLAEVPTGVLADRISRRGSIAAGGVAQALAYVLWSAFPEFGAFAAGFVLWGIGGTLVSGALEAWLYDALVDLGEPARFQRLYGRISSCELIAQIPAAIAATVLFPWGGFALVGWASVGTCLGAAVLAARLPEPSRRRAGGDGAGDDAGDDPDSGDGGECRGGDHAAAGGACSGLGATGGYLATLRAGIGEAVRAPAVRRVLVVVALLTSVDDIEEFFPLLAENWGVPPQWVPVATLGIPLAGACGALLAGRVRPARAGPLLLAATGAFAAAGVWASPSSLVLVAGFYAVYRGVLVVANARLQEHIDGTARATVTSVAGVGTDLAGLLLLGAWALAGLPAALVLTAFVAVLLPWGLRAAAGTTG